MIQFWVPCCPVAQPRQRQRVVSAGGRNFSHNYTPTKHPVNALKSAIQVAARAVYQGAPLEGALRLTLTFILPRPKAMCWKKRPTPRARHVCKPDVDNLTKPVDCLTGLLWRDDSQIAELHVEKYIAAGDEAPGVEVVIDVLAGVNP